MTKEYNEQMKCNYCSIGEYIQARFYDQHGDDAKCNFCLEYPELAKKVKEML